MLPSRTSVCAGGWRQPDSVDQVSDAAHAVAIKTADHASMLQA